jgi:hypothetical protein
MHHYQTGSFVFHVLFTMHLGIILINDQLDIQFFFYMFTSIPYMFWATSCSSSGESIVSIQHLVRVTLCRCLSSMQYLVCSMQSNTYQMLYWYNWFSWWWARGCSKHVENWNKHIKKELCVKLVIYKNYVVLYFPLNRVNSSHPLQPTPSPQ